MVVWHCISCVCVCVCVFVGSEIAPDLDIPKRKFCFNLILPTSDETREIRLYFDTVSLPLITFYLSHFSSIK
jgi:hypothetical protein